jgi:hypothetical protein
MGSVTGVIGFDIGDESFCRACANDVLATELGLHGLSDVEFASSDQLEAMGVTPITEDEGPLECTECGLFVQDSEDSEEEDEDE